MLVGACLRKLLGLERAIDTCGVRRLGHCVAVGAPGNVAALVSGNDVVAVIDARRRARKLRRVVTDIAGMLLFQCSSASLPFSRKIGRAHV